MKLKLLLSQILISTFLVSCENPMRTMRDMKNTTADVAATSKAMATRVENTDRNSANLGILMTQGNTSDFRDKQFDNMVAEKDFNGKADYAGKFMYSMEFQVWAISGIKDYDSIALLERARQEAIIELAKKIDVFYMKDFIKKLDGTESDQAALNFFAIAAAVHRLNPKQIVLRKNANIPFENIIDPAVQEMTRIDLDTALDVFTQTRYTFPTETVLDLIVQGLLKVKDVNEGRISRSELRPFEIEVLKEELKFKRIIEARFKFFPAIALARMSKIDEGGFLSKLVSKAKMLFFKWEPNFLNPELSKNMNNMELAYVNEILAHSLKAKNLLIELGDKPVIDSKIEKIYNNMDLSKIQNRVIKAGYIENNQDQLFIKLDKQINELLK